MIKLENENEFVELKLRIKRISGWCITADWVLEDCSEHISDDFVSNIKRRIGLDILKLMDRPK